VVDEIDMQRMPDRRRYNVLQNIVGLLPVDSRRQVSHPIHDAPAVAVDGKDVSAQRVHHHASGRLGPHARKADEELLCSGIAHPVQRCECYGAEPIPNPGHLVPEAVDLDPAHAAGRDRGDQLLLRNLQQPAPITVDNSCEGLVAPLVCVLPGAYRQLDEDEFVNRIRLVPEGPGAVFGAQPAVDLEQLVSSQWVQGPILR
jgi:hypothetical protein